MLLILINCILGNSKGLDTKGVWFSVLIVCVKFHRFSSSFGLSRGWVAILGSFEVFP